MKKKASIRLFLISFLFISFIFVGSFFLSLPIGQEVTRINLTCPVPICEPPLVSCGTPNITIQDVTLTTKVYTSHFQELITSCYEEKPYKKGGWDCDRMSNACAKRLQNAGYPCHTQVGYLTQDGKREAHAWIECGNNNDYLIIETTSGQIVPPWEWERYKAK